MAYDTLTPKQRFAEFQRLSTPSLFGYTYDPIADELKAPENYATSLRGYPVVPFCQRGEVTIPFIRKKLCSLSPTNGAIIAKKLEFTLGGQWRIQRRKAESWAIDEELLPEVTVQEAEETREWIKETFGSYSAIEDVSRPALRNYLEVGNAFIELRLFRVGGFWYARLYNHDITDCLYLPTAKDQPRVVQVFPFWYSDEAPNCEPEMIPVYPNFGEMQDGSIRTIFHIKNHVPGRKWYGEPSWLLALYYVYNEIQLGEYTVNGYSNDWLPRVFIETYEGFGNESPPTNPEEDTTGTINREGPEGFRSNMDSFFTRQGTKRSRWLHRNVPEGGQPSSVHEFSPSQDYKGHKSDTEVAQSKIIIAHNWHPELMVSTPGRLGGAGAFKEAFQATYYTTIKPLEDLLVDQINKILRIVDEYQGGRRLETLSVGLENLYAFMLYDSAATEEEAKQPDSTAHEGTPDVTRVEDDPEDPEPEDE